MSDKSARERFVGGMATLVVWLKLGECTRLLDEARAAVHAFADAECAGKQGNHSCDGECCDCCHYGGHGDEPHNHEPCRAALEREVFGE